MRRAAIDRFFLIPLILRPIYIFRIGWAEVTRMPPATRLTDVHACPVIPAGPVVGPCVPNVLTGKLPQAVVGDLCICIGPPDPIVRGSRSVFVGKRPAARLGDATGKNGALIMGFATVHIGDKTPSGWGAADAPCLKKAARAAAPFVRA
jgi:uncharacterized Zn-binding protein involved in type VI secretion